MKTLQEKYNAILEGNFSKTQFVRDARLAHSNLITQFNSFADTVAILKNKGMVVEAKKAEVTAYKKPEVDPIDMIAPDLLDHGIEAELHAAGITGTPSEEEYAKAKEKAAKELIKDPLCYKNAQTMTEPGEKMEKAKLSEGSKENYQRTSLIDKFAQPEIASAAAEKPFKVSKAFRDMAIEPENREKYLKMSPEELYAAANELEEANKEPQSLTLQHLKDAGVDQTDLAKLKDFEKLMASLPLDQAIGFVSNVLGKDIGKLLDLSPKSTLGPDGHDWAKADTYKDPDPEIQEAKDLEISPEQMKELHKDGKITLPDGSVLHYTGTVTKEEDEHQASEDGPTQASIDMAMQQAGMKETQLKEAVKSLIKKTLES